ncbi:hypothetical protein SAMN05660484_00504 [Eubacterium ruminantium]|uniref:Uncharacterized protein n=1 Tax=Eubacterium ruminantium TaxID=42322 RepID=A0A1T4KLK6_9FIRM|nr:MULTISPECIES: hypothetical protein [Eubacterium]MCR5367028.1 hypothetical protein [Eubacterium sp.]SCW33184.1 hypothetical protein SAMN05660484_00504 [Eubacterium ruminantium]SDM30071.1 hypothetical protein SAMN04490370_102167 [Eubacterium ruminantium]SJZ43285.1 hypothetical protein SAMN02745110_00459 [Eubacterium ruminantium]
MSIGWIIFIIVLVVIIGALIALYIAGNKMQKKQLAQKEEMLAQAQPANMLIIDKKYMPLKDAKFPKIVMEQTPKKYQKAKVPVVKAKVGPQIVTLMCDEAIYDDIPTKGEVKAMVSGIYIVSVKSVRKQKNQPVEEETNGKKKKRKSFDERLRAKRAQYQAQLKADIDNKKTKEQLKAEKEKAKREREKAKKITN